MNDWERWFAWYPVKAHFGGYRSLWTIRWLCYVDRVWVGKESYGHWEYDA